MTDTYTAVIVHYRDPEAALTTVELLAQQSVRPAAVAIVDNSALEMPVQVPSNIAATHIPMDTNRGYAGAVNASREFHTRHGSRWVLVLTQDARLENDAVEQMIAVARSTGAACVGPTLYFSSDKNRIFSRGGHLESGSRPVHDRASAQPAEHSVEVTWVDGAILLLDREQLDRVGWFKEEYFLYYEEVDLAHRLGEGRVRVATRARAYQEPGNFTSYLQLRNQILFWRRNGRPRGIVSSISYQALRSAAAVVLKRKGKLSDIYRGVRDGIRDTTGAPPRNKES